MKHVIHTLNKAFDHRVRLGVMTVLMTADAVSFSDLKEVLDLTDGNLASHVAALEKVGYVTVSKQFRRQEAEYDLHGVGGREGGFPGAFECPGKAAARGRVDYFFAFKL